MSSKRSAVSHRHFTVTASVKLTPEPAHANEAQRARILNALAAHRSTKVFVRDLQSADLATPQPGIFSGHCVLCGHTMLGETRIRLTTCRSNFVAHNVMIHEACGSKLSSDYAGASGKRVFATCIALDAAGERCCTGKLPDGGTVVSAKEMPELDAVWAEVNGIKPSTATPAGGSPSPAPKVRICTTPKCNNVIGGRKGGSTCTACKHKATWEAKVAKEKATRKAVALRDYRMKKDDGAPSVEASSAPAKPIGSQWRAEQEEKEKERIRRREKQRLKRERKRAARQGMAAPAKDAPSDATPPSATAPVFTRWEEPDPADIAALYAEESPPTLTTPTTMETASCASSTSSGSRLAKWMSGAEENPAAAAPAPVTSAPASAPATSVWSVKPPAVLVTSPVKATAFLKPPLAPTPTPQPTTQQQDLFIRWQQELAKKQQELAKKQQELETQQHLVAQQAVSLSLRIASVETRERAVQSREEACSARELLTLPSGLSNEV